jgi:hypothetical protein
MLLLLLLLPLLRRTSVTRMCCCCVCPQVVERHWYERNKHIFPASRWEIFDPEKSYGDKYTIKG